MAQLLPHISGRVPLWVVEAYIGTPIPTDNYIVWQLTLGYELPELRELRHDAALELEVTKECGPVEVLGFIERQLALIDRAIANRKRISPQYPTDPANPRRRRLDPELVKERIDIGDLVSEFVQLKKRGRHLEGLCPFHHEKTASFVVTPERGTWHCFGCGQGGDSLAFLMAARGIAFPEALAELAGRAGIAMP